MFNRKLPWWYYFCEQESTMYWWDLHILLKMILWLTSDHSQPRQSSNKVFRTKVKSGMDSLRLCLEDDHESWVICEMGHVTVLEASITNLHCKTSTGTPSQKKGAGGFGSRFAVLKYAWLGLFYIHLLLLPFEKTQNAFSQRGRFLRKRVWKFSVV